MESNKCISITAWNDYEITLDYKPSIIFAIMISDMCLQNLLVSSFRRYILVL